jgi:hypothetical protein
MPDQTTHADSLRFFHSGAEADDDGQTDPNACLGNYRSSTEIEPLDATITSPISNVTVEFIAGANGTGSGTLTASGADELRWTPPGGTIGAAVTITNGQTKILEGGGGETNKFIRVTRTSATALTGTATLTIVEVFNNAVGFDNVSSAEAAAGDNEYRALFIQNRSAVPVSNLKVYIGTLGTQRTTNSAQLGASGSGTIGTTGSFADWPDSGFAHVKTSGGTTREIVYYSSRTSTVLTVPAAGRGLLGTSAGAGAATDTVDAVPGIRIAAEAPDAPTDGKIQIIANEGTAPTAVSWNTGTTAAGGVSIGTLDADEIYGLWIHRHVVVGEVATPSLLNLINFSFDAA